MTGGVESSASIVILRKEYLKDCSTNSLVVENPYYAYAKVAELFIKRSKPNVGIHPSAQVAENCNIHQTARIGANCVLSI